MKVVYSFINPHLPEFIPVEVLHIGILSSIKSLELYGNSTFTSNSTLIQKFKECCLPFSDYEEINIDTQLYKLPYISKLVTYKSQTEPFLHLDLDFILFEQEKLNEDGVVKFSHKDIKRDWEFINIDGINQAYFKPAIDLSTKYGKQLLNNIRLDQIPNMGAVMCNDTQLFSKAVNKVLDFYYSNVDYFDSDYASGCFLEQAMINKYLIEYSQNYKTSVFNSNNNLYDRPPLLFINEKDEGYEVDDWYNGRKLKYSSLRNLVENYNFEDLPAVHLLGSSKLSLAVQLIIIHRLIKHIGIEILEKIEFYFGSGEGEYLNKYKKLFL